MSFHPKPFLKHTILTNTYTPQTCIFHKHNYLISDTQYSITAILNQDVYKNVSNIFIEMKDDNFICTIVITKYRAILVDRQFYLVINDFMFVNGSFVNQFPVSINEICEVKRMIEEVYKDVKGSEIYKGYMEGKQKEIRDMCMEINKKEDVVRCGDRNNIASEYFLSSISGSLPESVEYENLIDGNLVDDKNEKRGIEMDKHGLTCEKSDINNSMGCISELPNCDGDGHDAFEEIDRNKIVYEETNIKNDDILIELKNQYSIVSGNLKNDYKHVTLTNKHNELELMSIDYKQESKQNENPAKENVETKIFELDNKTSSFTPTNKLLFEINTHEDQKRETVAIDTLTEKARYEGENTLECFKDDFRKQKSRVSKLTNKHNTHLSTQIENLRTNKLNEVASEKKYLDKNLENSVKSEISLSLEIDIKDTFEISSDGKMTCMKKHEIERMSCHNHTSMASKISNTLHNLQRKKSKKSVLSINSFNCRKSLSKHCKKEKINLNTCYKKKLSMENSCAENIIYNLVKTKDEEVVEFFSEHTFVKPLDEHIESVPTENIWQSIPNISSTTTKKHTEDITRRDNTQITNISVTYIENEIKKVRQELGTQEKHNYFTNQEMSVHQTANISKYDGLTENSRATIDDQSPHLQVKCSNNKPDEIQNANGNNLKLNTDYSQTETACFDSKHNSCEVTLVEDRKQKSESVEEESAITYNNLSLYLDYLFNSSQTHKESLLVTKESIKSLGDETKEPETPLTRVFVDIANNIETNSRVLTKQENTVQTNQKKLIDNPNNPQKMNFKLNNETIATSISGQINQSLFYGVGTPKQEDKNEKITSESKDKELQSGMTHCKTYIPNDKSEIIEEVVGVNRKMQKKKKDCGVKTIKLDFFDETLTNTILLENIKYNTECIENVKHPDNEDHYTPVSEQSNVFFTNKGHAQCIEESLNSDILCFGSHVNSNLLSEKCFETTHSTMTHKTFQNNQTPCMNDTCSCSDTKQSKNETRMNSNSNDTITVNEMQPDQEIKADCQNKQYKNLGTKCENSHLHEIQDQNAYDPENSKSKDSSANSQPVVSNEQCKSSNDNTDVNIRKRGTFDTDANCNDYKKFKDRSDTSFVRNISRPKEFQNKKERFVISQCIENGVYKEYNYKQVCKNYLLKETKTYELVSKKRLKKLKRVEIDEKPKFDQ